MATNTSLIVVKIVETIQVSLAVLSAVLICLLVCKYTYEIVWWKQN